MRRVGAQSVQGGNHEEGGGSERAGGNHEESGRAQSVQGEIMRRVAGLRACRGKS